MITDFLLDLIFGAVDFVVGFLPTTSGTLSGLGFLGDLDYFLPIHETVTVVAAVMILGPQFVVAQIVIWVYHQFWGSN